MNEIVLILIYTNTNIMSAAIYAYTRCSVRFYPHVFVGGLLIFIYVICAWCVWWCPTRIDYMNNMVSVLLEAGTAYPWQAPEFTTGFRWGLCYSSF